MTTNIITQSLGGSAFIQLVGGNGFGSINTRVRRFNTVLTNTGTDVTLTQSSTDGDSFTINSTGIYSITYEDSRSAGTDFRFGINLNGDPGTDIDSLAAANRLGAMTRSPDATKYHSVHFVAYLTKDDVLRAQGRSDQLPTSSYADAKFTIVRI